MSKQGSGQKRTMGKKSPLHKRPKLDFGSPSDNTFSKPRESNNINFSDRKGMNSEAHTSNSKAFKNGSSTEWDDDFSGDMLEKALMIADLSQAMADKEHSTVEEKKILKPSRSSISTSHQTIHNDKLNNEIKALKSENEKLMESLKTKEGEVQILRSQLKQHQENKHSESVQNIKLFEDMQKKVAEKVVNIEKENEAVKTKLQFKELEVKSLTERCKQLESSTSKIRLVEPEAMHFESRKSAYNLTQASISTQYLKVGDSDIDDIFDTTDMVPDKNICADFVFPEWRPNLGEKLSDVISPEFFRFVKEPSVVPLYTFRSDNNRYSSSLDFDKREKYKWSGLPKQTVFVKDLYDNVTSLFSFEDFNHKFARTLIQKIVNSSFSILNYQRDQLLFLENLQHNNNEYDDSDKSLLENEEGVQIISIKDILDNRRIKAEECGIEARRTLALLLCLLQATDTTADLIFGDPKDSILLRVIKDISVSVGNLRRPLRYTGLLVAMTLIVREALQQDHLNADVITLISEIMEEIIFARPKLDVLREIIITLQNGYKHLTFLSSLCRKVAIESCALYMDSKLRQAMFFTKDACPLKILCIQIAGLSCLPSSRTIRCDFTNCIIKLLNYAMDADLCRTIKWLPSSTSIESDDRCFDVTEYLSYMLNLCVSDWRILVGSVKPKKIKIEERRNLASVIGNGALLMRRILKTDQRLLHENAHNLKFIVEVRSLMSSLELTPIQVEAIVWISELLETDSRNQESSGKSLSALSDQEIFETLKLNTMTIF